MSSILWNTVTQTGPNEQVWCSHTIRLQLTIQFDWRFSSEACSSPSFTHHHKALVHPVCHPFHRHGNCLLYLLRCSVPKASTKGAAGSLSAFSQWWGSEFSQRTACNSHSFWIQKKTNIIIILMYTYYVMVDIQWLRSYNFLSDALKNKQCSQWSCIQEFYMWPKLFNLSII